MYIKELFIDGFRNFKDIRIPFHEGLNILIGHNNAGKSNLLSAIALVLSDDINKKLQINDFSHKATLEELQSRPPKIEINLVFEQSEGEPADSEEIVALSEYTINTTEPYEIQLNYEYYLPTDYEEEYFFNVKNGLGLNLPAAYLVAMNAKQIRNPKLAEKLEKANQILKQDGPFTMNAANEKFGANQSEL